MFHKATLKEKKQAGKNMRIQKQKDQQNNRITDGHKENLLSW